MTSDWMKRIEKIKSVHVERVRTMTGSGMRVRWGPYHFTLVGMDGTPERTLTDEGVCQVLQAIFKFKPEEPAVLKNGDQG